LLFRLSVYCLPSIIGWGDCVFQASYSVLEDNTLLVEHESIIHPNDRHILLPLSPGRNISPEELQHIASEAGFENIWFVPQDYLDMHNAGEINGFFEVTEQRDYEDYVYLTEDLASLKGNRYAGKRNLVKQFNRDYVGTGAGAVGEIRSEDVPECLDFLERWCEQRDCNIDRDENLACERKAVIHSLINLEWLEMMSLLIRIDGKVCAFAIGSRLTEDIAVLNFEKADSNIRGLYQYLDMECARRLFPSYRYINKESDMNMENLAKSKHSYHPVLRVKSYRFRLR
jgi:hypothetical protein